MVKKKWIRRNARKVFASPNKMEALYHFIKRKNRHISILNYNLSQAIEARHVALKKLLEKSNANKLDETYI